jgi:ribosomal protein S25
MNSAISRHALRAPFGLGADGTTNLSRLEAWLREHETLFNSIIAWQEEVNAEDRWRRAFENRMRERLARYWYQKEFENRLIMAVERIKNERFEMLANGNPTLKKIQQVMDAEKPCYGPPPEPPSLTTGGTQTGNGSVLLGTLTRPAKKFAFDAAFLALYPDVPSDPDEFLEALADENDQFQRLLSGAEEKYEDWLNDHDEGRRNVTRLVPDQVRTRRKEQIARLRENVTQQKVISRQKLSDLAGIVASVAGGYVGALKNVDTIKVWTKTYNWCTYMWFDANYTKATGDPPVEKRWTESIHESTARAYLKRWFEFTLEKFGSCACQKENPCP